MSSDSRDKAECVRPRLLREGDLLDAVSLSSLAGWNQTIDDWRLLLELSPDNCFCIDSNGSVVATTTLVPYGDRLGWIGMVLTHPNCRRLGFATRLLSHALARAEMLGIKTLKLDATEQGQPLYRDLGFVVEQTVERWARPGLASALTCQNDSREWTSGWSEIDNAAFGADRRGLVEKLTRRAGCLSNANSYLWTRPGRVTAYLGPCISLEFESARELIRATIEAHTGSWSWDVLRRNSKAVELAMELGFTPQRRLLRMVRGQPMAGKDGLVYAIAGFEFG